MGNMIIVVMISLTVAFPIESLKRLDDYES